MYTRTRWSRSPLVVLLALLALVGAACSDDDEPAAAAGEAAAEGETAAAQTEGSSGEEDWPDSITFAAVPSEQSSQLAASFQATIDILTEELGVDIEFFQAADYAGVIEAMIAGEVDLAQFGPFSYVIAKGNGADIEPVAAIVDEPGGEPGYQSYGITRSDNAEIESLDDFAGKKVCFVDPGSTSGFLYPSAGLLEAGIDPETGVDPIFAGGHDASALSVANGDCDAGFAFDAMVDTELIKSGDLEEGALKTVWKSEIIAGSPVAVSLDLPADMVEAIKSAFTELVNVDHAVEAGVCESADTCSLSDEGNWGYVEVDDSFYDGVRKVCEVTKAATCEGL